MLRYLMFLLLVPVVLFASNVSAVDPVEPPVCGNGCVCPDLFTASCKGIAEIPSLTNGSLILSLTIESHSITELNKDDFIGFTHLQHLHINKGVLHTLAPGTFEHVKETIILIHLTSNAISELDSGVFVNLTAVNKIVLNANHLTKIKAETFVNMPKLVNLYILNNYLESIDKDAFKDLPELGKLNLFNNRLTEIPFESLNSLKGIKEVVLTNNKIKSIPVETDVFIPTLEDIYLDSNPLTELKVFPNISKSLKRLNLQFTNISRVTKDTWKYTSSLDFLNIGGTKFREITVGTFEGLPNVKTLLLRDMMLLTFIGPDAFRGIKTPTTVIDLGDCKRLRTIDESAFMSINVSSIFLKDSGVTYIPKNLVKWSKAHIVSLGKNPINCDCKVEWMLDASVFGNNTAVQQSFDELVCASPKEHFGKHVTTLHPINLTCKPIPADHATRFATGIIIAVICLVSMTTFALLMKYRKRIMISCRRYYQYRRFQNDIVFTMEHDSLVIRTDRKEGLEGYET